MPIKDRTIYPPYWPQFSKWVREERAGNRCEACKVPNGADVCRGEIHDRPFWFDDNTGTVYSALDGSVIATGVHDYELDMKRETRIVLTVAHLDHDGGPCTCKAETGRKCARPDHVLALCQRCHLLLDMPKHIENRRRALAGVKDAARGLFAGV